MSELVKELANKAGYNDLIYEISKEGLNKLAELIVRECGKSCTLQGDEDDMFRKFGIKQHTGIE